MTNISWEPGTSIDALKARAKLLSKIRLFFDQRSVLEVETPILGLSADNDPNTELFHCLSSHDGSNERFYLQPSPELFMKRLIAYTNKSIFQISKAFRNYEKGKRHNIEFSILEWYRINFSMEELMKEVSDLMHFVLEKPNLKIQYIKYVDLFREFLHIDISEMGIGEIREFVEKKMNTEVPNSRIQRDDLLDLLLGEYITPMLGLDQLLFVTDFPASQSSLAKISDVDTSTARRFELFYNGYELANGFEELSDYFEQSERFNKNNLKRKIDFKEEVNIDKKFLSALNHGLPECSGVAIGLDRILMCLMGTNEIDNVLTFSFERI